MSQWWGRDMSFDGAKPGDERFDNALGLRLCWCPPGAFTMGPNRRYEVERTYRLADERRVKVRLSRGFWLGKCETTQGQWTALMGTRPWVGQAYSGYAPDHADHPAVYVSWNDAVEFCRRLTESEHAGGRLDDGREYRLPTEAQWEYACRAGSSTPYWFGANTADLADHEWIDENTFARDRKHPQPVGTKSANPWGLHDLHGNVAEWCRDVHCETVPGGLDPEAIDGGPDRVFRGGSFAYPDWECRSASRHHYPPTSCGYTVGFRVAMLPRGGGGGRVRTRDQRSG